jgi:hypothetical protein
MTPSQHLHTRLDQPYSTRHGAFGSDMASIFLRLISLDPENVVLVDLWLAQLDRMRNKPRDEACSLLQPHRCTAKIGHYHNAPFPLGKHFNVFKPRSDFA